MCGIVGIVGAPSGEGHPELPLERMTALLGHRGPDARGFWRSRNAHFGHTRLSILDLSPAGAQPMEKDGQVLLYNGEVYNFRELREELRDASARPFDSDGDSEVVLRLFKTQGVAGLSRLEGMFAFSVWDEAAQELVLVRDFIGIKPLYYRLLPRAEGPGRGLAFASEPGPLLELGRPSLDTSTLRDYLMYGYIPTPKTPWEGIFKLPAAHFLRWRKGEIMVERYWSLEPGGRSPSEADAVRETAERLGHAVRSSTVSDVPLGLFLSGGVDSGTIATFSDSSIQAFSLGQPEKHRNETEVAAELCGHLGLIHHAIEDRGIDLPQAVDAVLDAFAEPFSDSGALSVWLLSRFVSRHVKVALSGEGGDELFSGYRWYGRAMTEPSRPLARIAAALAPTLTKLGRSWTRRSVDGLERFAAFVGTFTPAQVRALAGPAMGGAPAGDDLLWHYRKFWREELPIPQRLQAVDLQTYMADGLLTKVDRASMAFSLEVRPPFLHPRLVDHAFGLDPALHRHAEKDQGKRLLRQVAAARLPEGYLERPKRGFNLAIGRWVKKHPDLWQRALRRLASEGFIRRPRILDLTNDQTWSLLILDGWLARNVPGYPRG